MERKEYEGTVLVNFLQWDNALEEIQSTAQGSLKKKAKGFAGKML